MEWMVWWTSGKIQYRMVSKNSFVKIQDRLYKYRYKYSLVRGPWWSSMKCNKAAINCNAFIGKRYFKECENNCNELIFTMMLNQLVWLDSWPKGIDLQKTNKHHHFCVVKVHIWASRNLKIFASVKWCDLIWGSPEWSATWPRWTHSGVVLGGTWGYTGVHWVHTVHRVHGLLWVH